MNYEPGYPNRVVFNSAPGARQVDYLHVNYSVWRIHKDPKRSNRHYEPEP